MLLLLLVVEIIVEFHSKKYTDKLNSVMTTNASNFEIFIVQLNSTRYRLFVIIYYYLG
jgi:hypothetical protein